MIDQLIPKSVKDTYSRFGILKTLTLIFHLIVNKFVYLKVLKAMILTFEDVDKKYLIVDPKFTCLLLTPQDVTVYADDPGNDLTKSFLQKVHLKNDECYAIIDENKLANYGWYSSNQTEIDENLVVCFCPTWKYMYKGYTHKQYRGQNLHAISMAKALENYTKIGFKGLISYVEYINFASLLSIHRTGYKIFGSVFIIRLFGKFLIFRTPGCKKYDFTVKQL